MKIVRRPSPNFNDRAPGKAVGFLVLHYTDTQGARETLEEYLLHPERGVSAHYLVDEDGTVYALVDEERRAWHAGRSFWAGEEDLNSCSVGIEIQNPGHRHGYRAFPPAQVDAVAALCRGVLSRHPIPAHHVLAHSDIAPARKKDPGELFPWQALAAQGVGAWPRVAPEDRHGDAAGVRDLLVRYGYDHRLDDAALLTAFHRHFMPSIFTSSGNPGAATQETVYLLNALLRQKLT